MKTIVKTILLLSVMSLTSAYAAPSLTNAQMEKAAVGGAKPLCQSEVAL